jgi:hypothetical protein
MIDVLERTLEEVVVAYLRYSCGSSDENHEMFKSHSN